MVSIFYATFYGSTKQYADALAEHFGKSAEEITDDTAALISAASPDPLIILSPVHGPAHPGVKLIKALSEDVLRYRPVALATVGMTLDHVTQSQDPAGKLLGDRAQWVSRFYLPGRLNYSELSKKHHKMMEGIVFGLKLTGAKGENENMIVDTYGKDVDRVDLSRIEPIVQWVGNHTW